MATSFLLIGQTLGHYCIVEQIGAGAMGVVYRARDKRLDRDVALKILPPGVLADEAARKRFRKEALALAKVSHPNVAHVYDFDTQEGIDFLVMEFVVGATLADELNRRVLTEAEVRRIGEKIASGLAQAHDVGVVHRDLKPTNIVITNNNEVKLLDFGLARLLRQDSVDETATEASAYHSFAGTLPYMAPEQLRGDRGEPGTDIYSLGVVLFEMSTGQRPFQAHVPTALMADILHEAPPRPRQLRANLSSDLQRIILKCLEKDKRQRYLSAHDLCTELKAEYHPGRSKSGGAKRITSVAVLPFENVSGDPDMEYLSEGITETIINRLSSLPRLRVVPRSTVSRYKGRQVDSSVVGRDLEVRGVVLGRVLQRGARLIVKAELIDVEQEKQLWGEQYDRNTSDILAVETEISNEITNNLRVRLSSAERKKLLKQHTINPGAYQAYIKGRYYWNKRLEGGLTKAIEHFKQAIDVDPCYALAYTGLADSYNLAEYYRIMSGKVAFPRAVAAASKALEIDENLAEGYTSLGFANLFFARNWSAAHDHFLRAIRLNSGYALAHQWYSFYLAIMKRMDEAITEMEQAQTLESLSLAINTTLGLMLYFSGQYDRAIEQYRNTLELDPAFVLTQHWLGLALVQVGKFEEAVCELQKANQLSTGYPAVRSALGYALGASGNKAEARRLFQDLEKASCQRYVSPYDYSLVAIGLGEDDRAVQFLSEAADDRCSQAVWMHIDPIFDPIRSGPRYADLLRRMGLPQ